MNRVSQKSFDDSMEISKLRRTTQRKVQHRKPLFCSIAEISTSHCDELTVCQCSCKTMDSFVRTFVSTCLAAKYSEADRRFLI